MKLCWIDLRAAGALSDAIRAAAIHQRVDAIVCATVDGLASLPPTVRRVLMPTGDLPADLAGADLVVVDPLRHGDPADLGHRYPDTEFGVYVEVSDRESLARACASAKTMAWTVLKFTDPTKIPLEIVLAAAAGAAGNVVTVAADPEDAAIIFGVLEHGSDGVLLAATSVGDVARLTAAAAERSEPLKLVELEVVTTAAVGMGERACVDTCTYLRPDEGILVGSHSKGMLLCVSETHPLPYMPTRPFRVNAGAIMSYTMVGGGRTQYLTELRAGSTVLAVDANGASRVVTVGRTKIETRPLLSIDAVAPDGRAANLIVQNDWHVRVLGPGGAVLNTTQLRPGDRILGYLPTEDRHVGYPIDELCHEQ
ncbi:MAG TPA: 3-dehydroquinate synthase II family protein [Micromonosporaceae bacterium]|nr:3-dehydroquinate synthase II family protein [Micromonosporaceae bacterium]